MDEATKTKLFEDLGHIKAKLENIEKNDAAQWEEIKELRKGVHTNDKRIAGVSTLTAAVFSFGMHLIKQTFGSGS